MKNIYIILPFNSLPYPRDLNAAGQHNGEERGWATHAAEVRCNHFAKWKQGSPRVPLSRKGCQKNMMASKTKQQGNSDVRVPALAPGRKSLHLWESLATHLGTHSFRVGFYPNCMNWDHEGNHK